MVTEKVTATDTEMEKDTANTKPQHNAYSIFKETGSVMGRFF